MASDIMVFQTMVFCASKGAFFSIVTASSSLPWSHSFLRRSDSTAGRSMCFSPGTVSLGRRGATLLLEVFEYRGPPAFVSSFEFCGFRVGSGKGRFGEGRSKLRRRRCATSTTGRRLFKPWRVAIRDETLQSMEMTAELVEGCGQEQLAVSVIDAGTNRNWRSLYGVR